MTSRLDATALTIVCGLLLSLGSIGCGVDEIGDDCFSSTDCSLNGDRVCDVASPGGYCTIVDCEMDTCPEEAVCVQFRFDPPRLATSSCMQFCESDGDCRDECDEANESCRIDYRCQQASQILGDEGEPLARSLDSNPNRGFCVPVVVR